MTILTSALLEPGAMFKVTDAIKDTVIPPGSLGFISLIRGTDDPYQNLAKVSVVLVRKGKGGKDRLLDYSIFVPVFYIDHKGFNKLLPAEGTRKGYVQIQRHTPMGVNISTMTELLFVGYLLNLV